MKYSRFEELPVWRDAIQLCVQVFALTASPSFRRYPSVRNQIERAALSISNNIAEGFERGTTQETLTFLYIARGSSRETRSVLCLCERLPSLLDLKPEISNLKQNAERISRQLRAWCGSLQDSNISGQRYLTRKSKAQIQAERERKEFLKELEQIRLDNWQAADNGQAACESAVTANAPPKVD
jgi:four helix bundle protein